jgi:hypothetical protein
MDLGRRYVLVLADKKFLIMVQHKNLTKLYDFLCKSYRAILECFSLDVFLQYFRNTTFSTWDEIFCCSSLDPRVIGTMIYLI